MAALAVSGQYLVVSMLSLWHDFWWWVVRFWWCCCYIVTASCRQGFLPNNDNHLKVNFLVICVLSKIGLFLYLLCHGFLTDPSTILVVTSVLMGWWNFLNEHNDFLLVVITELYEEIHVSGYTIGPYMPYKQMTPPHNYSNHSNPMRTCQGPTNSMQLLAQTQTNKYVGPHIANH